MKKYLLFSVLALILMISLLTGCSSSKTTDTGKYQILRQAILGGKWQMYQIEIKLDAGNDFDLDLLGLLGTDQADGYYYPEKGTGASLEITAGTTTIYKTGSSATTSDSTLSDRFSFTASQPAGTAYVLNFHNGSSDTVTVFVELIYPKTGAIRGPLNVN